MDAQKCLDIITEYMMGKDYYISDPVTNFQGNTIITHEILTKHSRQYRKEGRNLINEEFDLLDKTATVHLRCTKCGKEFIKRFVLDNAHKDLDIRKIYSVLKSRYRLRYEDCPVCSDVLDISTSTEVIGISYRRQYLANVRKRT